MTPILQTSPSPAKKDLNASPIEFPAISIGYAPQSKKLPAETKAWLSQIKSDGKPSAFNAGMPVTQEKLPAFLGQLKGNLEKAEKSNRLTVMQSQANPAEACIAADLGNGQTLIANQLGIKTNGIDDKAVDVMLLDGNSLKNNYLGGFHYLNQEKRFAAVDYNSTNGIPDFAKRYKADRQQSNDEALKLAEKSQTFRKSMIESEKALPTNMSGLDPEIQKQLDYVKQRGIQQIQNNINNSYN